MSELSTQANGTCGVVAKSKWSPARSSPIWIMRSHSAGWKSRRPASVNRPVSIATYL
jgi:hypothetical protein